MFGFVQTPPQNLLENDYAFMWLKDGILFCEYKPVVIDKNVVDEMIRDRLVLCNGKSYPALVLGNKVKYWTMEARIHSFRQKDSVTNITAGALVNDSPMGNAVVNWVTRFIDTKIPLKIFVQEEKAILWLQQFLPRGDR